MFARKSDGSGVPNPSVETLAAFLSHNVVDHTHATPLALANLPEPNDSNEIFGDSLAIVPYYAWICAS